MDSSLILSVARCDLGRALDLLCEGASPDLVTRDGSPLLHLALGHEDPEAALAMAQLLLVHGARLEARDPGTGLTALEAAQRLGRGEIVSLLRSYGGITSSEGILNDQTKTTFQRYIFDDDKTKVRGNNFLEEVANLFEDNIRGAKDTWPSETFRNSFDRDVTVKSSSQLKSFLCPGNTNLARSRIMCSTPTRSRDKSPGRPSLEISQVSSIGQVGPQGDQSVVNMGHSVAGRRDLSEGEDTFLSCLSDAKCDQSLSFTQQFLIEDKSEGVTMTEQRHSSVLAVAGKNSSLLNETSETLLASPDLNTTYTVTSHKEGDEFIIRFQGLMAQSLSDITSITRRWAELCRIEMEMCDKFTNISNSAADLVNQLTRESACKASFNYLLLDPAISANLPMKVFQESDQKLWRTFVNSVFYVGKGSRSRPFQHLYEAIKTFRKASTIKKLSDKIQRIHRIWDSGGGVVVVQVFQNTISVEAFTREAAMIQAIGCDNLTNLKPGDFYGLASGWPEDKRTTLGTFLVYKAFKIFLQEGERQIRPADLKS